MRELTGKWYLKKGIFGYKVMVEVKATTTSPYSLDQSPIFTEYQKALPEDLVELKILTIC